MRILYNISIYIYLIGIYITSFFNIKAKLWINGRKNLFKKLEENFINTDNVVWFHCASLGEFQQAKPIIKEYKLKYPHHNILLTFFSPSGYTNYKEYEEVKWMFYMPIDTLFNATNFIKTVKPKKAIFIKSEFWFNYISVCKQNNIPFYCVNTTIRKDHIFCKFKWFSIQLRNVDRFFVRDKKSEKSLRKIGCANITISGDSKFDSVILREDVDIPLIKEFSKDKKSIIFGSTWPKDESLILNFIKQNNHYKYIIAPHEINNIASIKNQTNGILYSEINSEKILKNNTIIIDNIGTLSSIYKYGDIAYIGGGFGKGIHNILEAVTYGLPVIFGPKYNNSIEAKELIKNKGAISISNYKELQAAIKIFTNFNTNINTSYVKKNVGATKTIIDKI